MVHGDGWGILSIPVTIARGNIFLSIAGRYFALRFLLRSETPMVHVLALIAIPSISYIYRFLPNFSMSMSILKKLLHTAVNDALFPREPLPAPMLANVSLSFTAPDFSAPLLLQEEQEETPLQELPLIMEIEPIGLYRHYLFVDAERVPSRFSCEGPGVVWFDLPAVESRLQFERLLKNSQKVQSQGLLIPLTLSYSRAEAEQLRGHFEIFHSFGLQIREIGQSVFLIDAIP